MTFYINENIFLDNVKQRMKLLYDKDDGHRGDVRMLMMLVYVSDSDIPVSVVWSNFEYFVLQRIYDLVSAKLEEKQSKAVSLLPRLTKNYVHGRE